MVLLRCRLQSDADEGVPLALSFSARAPLPSLTPLTFFEDDDDDDDDDEGPLK